MCLPSSNEHVAHARPAGLRFATGTTPKKPPELLVASRTPLGECRAQLTATLEMPLEERDEALASVDALLDDARAGRGRLLILEGPAGIGKTRLLAPIHERAEAAGMRTLRARAGELEQDFPFGIVRQLFEAVLAGPSRSELLAGAAELAQPVFDLAGSGELPAADPAYSTLHGLYWLTVNAAEAGPLLLSVDDLHCDPPASAPTCSINPCVVATIARRFADAATPRAANGGGEAAAGPAHADGRRRRRSGRHPVLRAAPRRRAGGS